MTTQMPDDKIHSIFDQIKAPDTSIERLQETLLKENENKQKIHHWSHYTVIAAGFLLILFAVSTVSANKAAIQKYTGQFMEYFYGKNQPETPEDSSAKKTVESSTDGNTRTKQIGEFQLTIYDTISCYSAESKTRLGCMYFSVKFTDPDSKNILAIWDTTGKQRFFNHKSEITKTDVTSKKYKSWIDMELENGNDSAIQYIYYYDEQKSSSGNYYFAARWYEKDMEDSPFGNTDMVSLTLFDYAIEFDENHNLDYGEQNDNDSFYNDDGITFHYQTDLEEKSFKLSNGYTLHVNAIGIWLTKQKKQSKAEARKEEESEDFDKIENKWISQVEKKRSNTTIKYNGQNYSLTELAPIAFGGIYLTAIETGNHNCWISAASFFENPTDIAQIETAY